MWIDTHTHFDAPVFEETRKQDWDKALRSGVSRQVMMGVDPAHFERLESLSKAYRGTYFALGIHPLWTPERDITATLLVLEKAVQKNRDNPLFVGIGEIGLDGFSPHGDWDRQVAFFVAQLKMAQNYHLPVFMHVRKAQDQVLKYCRRLDICQGVAHAFSGSEQQADGFIKQGFKLGFGGAFTFARAQNLKRLVKNLPLSAFVLETDCPDMPPAWVHPQKNHSFHLPQIAANFAQTRGLSVDKLAIQIQKNTVEAIPKLAQDVDKWVHPPTL